LIINNNKSIEKATQKEANRKEAIPMNYQQKQLAKVIDKQNKIKNHNEKILREKGYYNDK